jgi:type II secretory pathway pseudopilin PulG
MLKNKSGGFTLVEITIVMAITAAFAAVILAGQGAVRQQSEFRATVQTVATDIEAARNAAATSDSVGSGNNGAETLFSKLIIANQGASSISLTDVMGSGWQLGPCSGRVEALSTGAVKTINLDWGVTVNTPGAPNRIQVAFHRLLCGGQLQTYVFGTGLGQPFNQNKYSESLTPSVIAGQSTQIGFIDPQGNKATIHIDGSNNGAITVTYP